MQQKADLLVNIEYSSRILLGALYRQKQINPVDYIYESMNSFVQTLQPDTAEYNVIRHYIEETCDNFKSWGKFNVFKVMRKGEGERYEKFQHLQDRKLLFHGSSMTNFMGILAQGLRIAPPEAPTTGYMFGKGIYFADAFKKSAGYSRGGHQSDLMLLCEVALGNQLNQYVPNCIEKLPPGYDSLHAIGEQCANFKEKALITPEGF